MNRLVMLAKGVGALVLLLVLVAAVPVVLVNVAGWPLPSAVPTAQAIGDALTRSGVPETTIVKAVALVVWLAWLQLVLGVTVELVAVVRGRPGGRVPVTVAPLRHLAASLVATSMTLLGSLGAMRPVGATTAPIEAVARSVLSEEVTVEPVLVAPSRATVPPGPTWTVQRRDTLWGIAEQVLGNGERWREIARANVGREVAPGVVLTEAVEVLRPGWRLALPGDVPTSQSAQTIVQVARGDTLWSLAEECYGDPMQWRQIWEANRGRRFGDRVFRDPNVILAGWQLHIPGAEPGQAPGSGIGIGSQAPDPVTSAQLPDASTPATTVLPADVPATTVPAMPVPATPSPVPARPASTSAAGISSESATRATAAPAPAPVLAEGAAAITSTDPTSPSVWTITTGVAGAALLATGITGLLASRRRRRLERLSLDEVVPLPDPDLVPLERAARIGADPLAAVRLDVALRALAAAIAPLDHAEARPVVVRRSPAGDLAFFLTHPLLATAPWTSDDDAVWHLAWDVPLTQLAALAVGVPSPCPALVLLGTADGHELHLDLEAAATVVLGGRGQEARAIARGVIASLAVSPLAERVHVVAAGVDCYGFVNEQRVQAVADVGAGEELARSLGRSVAAALASHEVATTFALRARHPEELWEPVVVVAAGGSASDDEAVTRLGELAGRGVAVLTDAPVPGAHWRLHLDGESWRLEPLGVTLVPHGLAADELADLGALLTDAAVPAVVVARPAIAEPAAGAFDEPAWSLMVRVLGPVEVVDRLDGVVSFERAKALELVVWLAEHRHHPTRSAARTALWEVDVRDATFANVVSDARRSLARLVSPADDDEWIGRTYADDLPLHPLVVTDAELLAARLDHARRQTDLDAVATLREGLTLVRDLPFAGTSYLWPDGAALPSHHTVLVVSSAVEMANRCLQLDDIDGVFWATSQGMRALPAHDELVCLRMRAHSAQGNLAGVRQEYQSYERAVTADPWGDSAPSAKVVELRRQLLHAVRTG